MALGREQECDDDLRPCGGVPLGRRFRGWSLRVAGYLFFVYATTYFLVMDTERPAYDLVTWKEAYDSSYMFLSKVLPWQASNTKTSCWANRLFWPMDCLVQPWLKPVNKAAYDEHQREWDQEWWREYDRWLREWEQRPRDQKR
jgi:hypothetical protein